MTSTTPLSPPQLSPANPSRHPPYEGLAEPLAARRPARHLRQHTRQRGALRPQGTQRGQQARGAGPQPPHQGTQAAPSTQGGPHQQRGAGGTPHQHAHRQQRRIHHTCVLEQGGRRRGALDVTRGCWGGGTQARWQEPSCPECVPPQHVTRTTPHQSAHPAQQRAGATPPSPSSAKQVEWTHPCANEGPC
jgi:hypothetical protein